MLIFIVFCCLCLDVQIAERDRVQQCTNDDDADNDHLWTFMGDKICVWWWRQSLLPPANFFLNIDHKCSDEDIWDICTGPCICWWFLSNCLPLFVISSLPQYWSFPPWVQLNTSCRCIANELMHPRQWKQGLLIQGVFFNWAPPEFAKCWPVSNWFQKNVRVPDWPPLWSENA